MIAQARWKIRILAVAGLAAMPATHAASDIAVCRVGDGLGTLTSSSAPVFIERRGPDGTLRATVPLPTAASGANQPFSESGATVTECNLARSSNARFLVVPGYAAVPGVASIVQTPSATVKRVIARIDASDAVDTTTLFTTAFNGASIRSAASSDGRTLWASGNSADTTGGVWTTTFATSAGTQILATPNSSRMLGIFSGQLYGNSASGGYIGEFTIGTGLPVTAGQTATPLPGMPGASGLGLGQFLLFDRDTNVPGFDTLYVANDNPPTNGGIEKWTFDGSTWSLQTFLNQNIAAGIRGLTGEVVGNAVVLYGTIAIAANNEIVKVIDDGSPAPAFTTIAFAPANTVYRGLALAPDSVFFDGFDI